MRAEYQIYFEISAEVKKLFKNVLWTNEHYIVLPPDTHTCFEILAPEWLSLKTKLFTWLDILFVVWFMDLIFLVNQN